MDSIQSDWWRGNIRYDRKPHRFTSKLGPLRGNRPHFQVNIWKDGVSSLGRSYRIPGGFRTQWGNHLP